MVWSCGRISNTLHMESSLAGAGSKPAPSISDRNPFQQIHSLSRQVTALITRHNLRGFLAALALLSATQLSAQVKPLTLADCLNAALKNHPLMSSADQARISATYASEAIRTGFLPQIGIASHFIAAPGYDEAVTNGGEFGAQITASYLLYDGGARSYEIQKGGLGVEQSALNETRTKADIVYSVSVAFASAVKEKRELEVTREDYAQLRDYFQLVNQLHASGQGSETDLLKTTVDMNNAEIDVEARTVAYRNALLALAQSAGLSSTDVADVDTVQFTIPYDTTFVDDRNVDLASQRLVLKQSELEAQIAGSKVWPNVSLAADAGALTSLPNLEQGFSNVVGASLGLSVTVPFLTFGSIHDNYVAARATAKSISLQNDFARISLRHEFTMTKNNIDKARSEIHALRNNLAVAEQNFLLSKARYAGGSGLSLEVLDAIRTTNQIKLSIEEARSEMAVNILKLNRLNYTGATPE